MRSALLFSTFALLAVACADGEESNSAKAVTPRDASPAARIDGQVNPPPPPPRYDSGFAPPRYDVGPQDPPRFDGGAPPVDARVEPPVDARVEPPMDARVEPPVDARVEPPPVDARVEPPIDAAPLEPDADDLPPDPNVNAGWIGGPCAADQDCDYPEEAGGFCFRGDEGYPRGMCSLDCARTCPDRDGMPVTFCVGGLIAGNGACVQRCDYGAFVGGCRPGYHCETQGRYNEPGTTQSVCLPGEADPVDPPPDGTCQAQVAALGMQLEPAGGGSDSPATHPNLICTMNEPMFLYSPVNGVDYRYIESANPGRMYMGCALALALYRTGQLLQELDIVEVAHIGTYNCRVIAGTNTLSEHAHGEAIDFGAFFDRNGVEYNIVRHWEHNRSSNFQTEQGRILYEIAEQLYQRDIFSIVLTPNYNAAHDDHLHVDLSDGNLFSKAEGEGYFGPIPDEGCGGERHAP